MLRAARGRGGNFEMAVAALHDAMGIDHHTALMDAAFDRDIERARGLMTEHISFTLQAFVTFEGVDAGKAA